MKTKLLLLFLGVFAFAKAQNVNIPDPNLKAALVGNSAINTNGDNEIQVSEAIAYNQNINVPNNNIMDGTGLEAFTNMTGLNLTNNRLTTLDLSGNFPNLQSITYLFFASPASTLSSVTIGNAPQLEDVIITNHDISTFTMSTTNTSIKQLSLVGNELSNPVDVSFMPDLEFLFIGNNSIPSVDVTNNPLLKTLDADLLPITTLDLSNNSLLEVLRLRGTGITSLDVTQMTNLGFLSIADVTGLTSIDISNNTLLNTLRASGSGVTSLDISNNTQLTELWYGGSLATQVDLSNNSLVELLFYTDTLALPADFSNLPALTYVEIVNTSSIELDFSQNTNIEEFYLYNAPLIQVVRIANGNNTLISDFEADGNPNLSCVEVDDVAFATNNWFVESQTSFSTNCPPAVCVVNIPDTTFKSILVNDTTINTNGDTEIQCSEASAHTGGIFLFGAGVSDLTGLEAFTSLTELQVVEDTINTIDITDLVALEILVLDEISIATLDLSQNTSLLDLRLIDLPNLLSLDVSQNTMITQMQLSQLPMTALNLSQNAQLITINFDQLQVANLDLSNNPLSNVAIVSNNTLLENLDMRNGNNTALSNVNFTLNPNLNCIDVDDVAFATANWTNIDAGTIFSLDCSAQSNSSPVAICQNFTLQLDADGNATLNTADIDNGSNDTDGTITLSLDQTSFDCSNIGANTVTLTVTDDDGATDSCTATVTVEDNIAPLLIVPSNITVSNDSGECSAFVNLTIMNSDNCGLDTANTTNDVPAGFIFPVGITTVTATAADVNGNVVTDTFTVTVNDTEAPIINTPSNITVSNDPGVCGADVTFALSGTDNCGNPTITSDVPSGSTFLVGTTTVVLTADDGNGNIATDSFTITVNDTELPILTCPTGTITTTVNEGEQFEVPSYAASGAVVFTDNCGGTLIQTPTAGTMLGMGTYTITLDGTDTSGNTTSCSFDLTVDEVLSVEDATITSLKMYPNPATDRVSVESSAVVIRVEVYNLLGQKVLQFTENTFSVASLKAGMYIVSIEDAIGNKVNKQLIKK